MQLSHRDAQPRIDPSAYVAPTAVLCGDVEIGPEARILFNAVIVAEGGPVRIGRQAVVMEQAVVRGVPGAPALIGDQVLVGPRAYLVGCQVEDQAFIATGASVFNGAVIGRGAEVRINGTVHLRTRLPAFATVPIGWVAVGDPAQILPPERHEEIWAVQRALDFPGFVFGVERPPEGESAMGTIMERYTRALGRHRADRQPEQKE